MSRIDRKDQIIAAALELFRSKGFADVSTRDLAEHAGLSRSHVYHYFSDWNELRREAFVRFADEQLETARQSWLVPRRWKRCKASCATACPTRRTPAGRSGWTPGTRPCTTRPWLRRT